MEKRINYKLRQKQVYRMSVIGGFNATEGLRFIVNEWERAGKPPLTGGEVGHPKKGEELMVTRNFRIDTRYIDLIKEAGCGGQSIGLRRILAWYDAALRCAWCKRVIGTTDAGPQGSDGICPECEAKLRERAGEVKVNWNPVNVEGPDADSYLLIEDDENYSR